MSSMILGMFSWIADFFKALFDLIPKVMYLLYTSFACVLDILQLFFRKLAGLDVYYVEGKAVTGDLVTNFITGILGINKDNITYSALSTVFWSMIVFGVIVCFAATLIAIIKSHYTYDEKSAKGPMQYVYTAGKAIINMVAVPIIVVLGLYVSEALLTALDSITSTNSSTITAMYGDQKNLLVESTTAQGDKTYVYYDIFGFGSNIVYSAAAINPHEGRNQYSSTKDKKSLALTASKNETFSGSLFKTAAYNANRARIAGDSDEQIDADFREMFSGIRDSDELFYSAQTFGQLADMIDTAFSCNLHVNKSFTFHYVTQSSVADARVAWISTTYFTQFVPRGCSAFSKFNIGAVWYYYDLWQFNFIVGFAGCLVCLTIFINVILGLMTRLFMCIVLFLINPPLFGLAPLDGGKAAKSWQTEFMKQVLMTYGAVVGMNLMLMILPYMNAIDFFNIPIADYFARTLLIIVGLITIKAVIATVSGLIGAADANDAGQKISGEVGKIAGRATRMTLGAAKLGAKAAGFALKPAMAAGKGIGGAIGKGGEAIGVRIGNSKFGKAVASAGKKVGTKVANSKFGKATAWVGKKTGGFIKDLATGTTADERKAKKELESLENAKRHASVLQSLQGMDITDKDAIMEKAEAAGLSKKEAQQIFNSVKDNGSGKVDVEATTAAYKQMLDSKGAKTDFVKHYGTMYTVDPVLGAFYKRDKVEDELAKAEKAYNKEHRAAQGTARYKFSSGIKSIGSGALSWFGDATKTSFGKQDIVKEFRDQDDPARTTMRQTERTARMTEYNTLIENYRAEHGGAYPDSRTLRRFRERTGYDPTK